MADYEVKGLNISPQVVSSLTIKDWFPEIGMTPVEDQNGIDNLFKHFNLKKLRMETKEGKEISIEKITDEERLVRTIYGKSTEDIKKEYESCEHTDTEMMFDHEDDRTYYRCIECGEEIPIPA